jgi:hypothetical protein
MPLTKIQSLGITDGTIVNADINASAAIVSTKLSGVNDAKAWVNFNGTGTVAINASFNVTSITDNGTGYYYVNFTNNITDANYCVVADSGISGYRANTDILGSGNQTVSSSQVITSSTEDGTVRDAGIVCLAVFR